MSSEEPEREVVDVLGTPERLASFFRSSLLGEYQGVVCFYLAASQVRNLIEWLDRTGDK